MQYVCTADWRNITSRLTELVQLGGKVATKPAGPYYDRSELATRSGMVTGL